MMQLGDPKAAGAAFDLLSDYFSKDFTEVKRADKRYGKRRQLIAEPLASSVSSPAIKNNGWSQYDTEGGANSVLSDLSVASLLKGKRKDIAASKKTNASASPSEQGSQISFPRHKPDLHVEDYHSVADLVHRLTQRTGLQPGQVRVTKTPDSVVEKAAHIGDLQYKELRYSDRMQQILSEVLEVNTSISDIVPSVAGHRRDWGRVVENANKAYLRLFESMMSEILLIHRKKFKSQTKDITDLRVEKARVDNEIEQLKIANEVLRSRINSTELEFEKLRSMLRARDKQVTMLTEEVERLDEIRKEYMQYMADIRDIKARRDKEREELEARLRAEEQVFKQHADLFIFASSAN